MKNIYQIANSGLYSYQNEIFGIYIWLVYTEIGIKYKLDIANLVYTKYHIWNRIFIAKQSKFYEYKIVKFSN